MELEGKAAALRQEALQHMFIALAGTDCREMWTLLVTFFGKGMDQDPFEFLDAAPAIKKPLDLVDTDSDEEETSTADSTTSSPAVAGPSAGTSAKASAVPATAAKGFKLPPKPTWPDLHSSIDEAEGFVPRSANLLHHTGIPEGVTCKRSGTQTSRGPVCIFARFQVVVLHHMWGISQDVVLIYVAHITEHASFAPSARISVIIG